MIFSCLTPVTDLRFLTYVESIFLAFYSCYSGHVTIVSMIYEFLEGALSIWNWLFSATGLTTIGVGVAMWQLYRNTDINKMNNELAGAPRFYFTKPGGCDIYNNSDCSGGDFEPIEATGCMGERRVCWFGLANMGRFAARGVKIAVVRECELYNILALPEERWISLDYWAGNTIDGVAEAKLNGAEIIKIMTPIKRLEISPKDLRLYVLLEYASDYSGIRYKYLYEWCIDDARIDEYLQNTNNAKQENQDNSTINDRNYERLGFSRPVYLSDVRTKKVTSSNKVRLIEKRRVRKSKKRSITLSAEEWLKDY